MIYWLLITPLYIMGMGGDMQVLKDERNYFFASYEDCQASRKSGEKCVPIQRLDGPAFKK